MQNNIIYTWFLKNLESYRSAFLKDRHPNVFQDHADAYNIFSIDAYKAYVEGSRADTTRVIVLQECLREYCNIFGIDPICFENRYKHVTVTKHFAPTKDWRHTGQVFYQMFRENIKRHMDNMEDFTYEWNSGYIVSAFGTLGTDKIYRAYLSVSRRISPQVDFYYLINPTAALFMEED